MSWVALVVLSDAAATPLSEDVCKTYDAQQKILEIQGIREDLAKGPVWAKANLAASPARARKEPSRRSQPMVPCRRLPRRGPRPNSRPTGLVRRHCV
jgi:hypothetical protein